MKINVSSDAEDDLIDGYWFYEQQQAGLGSYFRASVISDIESLQIYGGVHQTERQFQRKLCKSFPFTIYYRMVSTTSLTVVAVLDQWQNPATVKKRLRESTE